MGTTLFDKNIYQSDEFPKLYHERWDIEELYKLSKTLIQVQDFHAQSERGVKQELFVHFVVKTLSRIFSNHIESGTIHEKHCSPDREIKIYMKNRVNSIINCRQRKRPNRSYERRSKNHLANGRLPIRQLKQKLL